MWWSKVGMLMNQPVLANSGSAMQRHSLCVRLLPSIKGQNSLEHQSAQPLAG